MKERNPATPENHSGTGGLGGLFSEDNQSPPLVTVASGLYAEQLPVGDRTVSEIRSRFRDRFDIDPRSQAVLDGNDVNDDTVVRSGQVLVFTNRAGEKGALPSQGS
jgi:hypothetical protein